MPCTPPACVALPSAYARARPKSATFTVPPVVTRMFSGLMSRWTMPWRVRGLEREQRLAHDLRGLRRLQPDVRVQQLARGAAADELHDHVVDAVDRAPVVDGHDVRMGERRGRSRLAAEPVDEPLVARERAVQDLDRDLAGEDGVVRAEDLAHPAGGDAFHDVVAAVEGDERLASGVTGGLGVRSTLGRGEPPSGEALRSRTSASERRFYGGEQAEWLKRAQLHRWTSPASWTGSRPPCEAGNTDLRALGFWRLVAQVKPDRLLVDRYADQIGRIDAAAFRASARFRMPVWAGNTILLIGAAAGLAAADRGPVRLVGRRSPGSC